VLPVLLLSLLTSAPERNFRARLDVGGLIGASWYVGPSRQHIEAAWENAKYSLLTNGSLDRQTMLYATPVVGPWMLSRLDTFDSSDRILLFTTGALQLLGLSVSAYRFGTEELGKKYEGLELSISPIAGGRLGFGIRLTGF
jgi:hypothetical protein